MKPSDLEDFIECYCADDQTQRVESEKFKKYTYEDIVKRDNTNLDIFWLKDESIEDSANLPEPKDLIEDILENLEYVKTEFEEIYAELEVQSDSVNNDGYMKTDELMVAEPKSKYKK